MRVAKVLAFVGGLLAAGVALSMVHPWGNPREGVRADAPLLEGSQAPENVQAILAGKCGDCHSERTHYPAYTYLAPVSWMLERDIQQGRGNLNMSEWPSLSDESRIRVLTRMAAVVRSGEMPPRSYIWLHPGARLSPDEQEQIYAWAKAERKRLRNEGQRQRDQSSIESGTVTR